MKPLWIAVGFLVAAPAGAQVRITIPVPTVTFVERPPLVEVEPGVRVIEDHDDEIFFVDDWYWVRRDEHWFRCRDHRGGWVAVESPAVPTVLVKARHGHYRHYKHPAANVVVHPTPHGVLVNPPGPHNAVRVKVKHH